VRCVFFAEAGEEEGDACVRSLRSRDFAGLAPRAGRMVRAHNVIFPGRTGVVDNLMCVIWSSGVVGRLCNRCGLKYQAAVKAGRRDTMSVAYILN
jgi:hypothetical protein